jgi:hypothetical protein
MHPMMFNNRSRHQNSLENKDNYIERLQGQKQVLENLILMAEKRRHYKDYKSKLPDLRVTVNKNIRDQKIREEEEAEAEKRRELKNNKSYSRQHSRSNTPPNPESYSSSLSPRRRSRSPSSRITRSPSPIRRTRTRSSSRRRSPSPRRRSPRSSSSSSSSSLSPRRSSISSLSPRSQRSPRSLSKSPNRRYSIEYDDNSIEEQHNINKNIEIEEFNDNNNMVIEDGEVVIEKEDNSKFIIDKNWILDCNCIDNDVNITQDDCFYCKHGSLYMGGDRKK